MVFVIRSILLTLLVCAGSASATGISVFYYGKAKSLDDASSALELARDIANRNGWRSERIDKVNIQKGPGIVDRLLHNREPIDMEKPLGLVIFPHPYCEPVYLVFSSNLIVDNIVKTHYAGPDVHIKVVELLQQISKHFLEFRITDESMYARSGNRKDIEDAIRIADKAIKQAFDATPNAKMGPFVRPTGRIDAYQR